MVDVSTLFNSSLEIGQFINASNTNLTGSLTTTLIIILGALILIAGIFKMPELIYGIVLIPVLIIFMEIDASFGTYIAVIISMVSISLLYLFFLNK